MESYSQLISKVLKNKTLTEAIDDNKTGFLNLATTNWENDLQNNPAYQNYLTSSSPMWRNRSSTKNYEYEISTSSIDVLLVARCIFYKSSTKPCVFVQNSEPLAKIAQAMTSDLPDVKLSNDFKFDFAKCDPTKCNSCFENAHLRSKGEESCISDITIYDGSVIKNRFYSQVKKAFEESFLAILCLNINRRYHYQKNYQEDQSTNIAMVDKLKEKTYKECRISGFVSHFIAFMESKILGSKVINVGTILPFEEECQQLLEDPSDTKDYSNNCSSLAYPIKTNNEKMITNTMETNDINQNLTDIVQQQMLENDNDSLEDLDDFIVEGSLSRKRKLADIEEEIDQNKIFGDCETAESSFLI